MSLLTSQLELERVEKRLIQSRLSALRSQPEPHFLFNTPNAISSEVVHNPELIVADVRLSDADLVVGIDFLGSRRIWLSYGSRQIFLSRRG